MGLQVPARKASPLQPFCEDRIPSLLQELSVEEKVGQLLMAHFQGKEANEDARRLVQRVHVGGIIYYNWSNGLDSPGQVYSLSQGLQELAKQTPHALPLLIAADQEGGVVARFKNQFTEFPGNAALGRAASAQLAKAVGLAMGRELAAVGVNMNLAPVIDVNSNPYNPIIGIRSLGSDPEQVAILGQRLAEGFREAGVITTGKHYPGHGDAAEDSHVKLPVSLKSMKELKRVELLPFKTLSTDAVMTAHLLVPALDPEHCATLSKTMIDYLKRQIGFNGVVITDSLIMKGVLQANPNIEEVALKAFDAGCDILLLGGKQLIGSVEEELVPAQVEKVHRFLVDAVEAGKISMQRLDESVEKILKLKTRCSLIIQNMPPLSQLWKKINTLAYRGLASRIAANALKIEGSFSQFTSLFRQSLYVISPQILEEGIQQAHFEQLPKSYGEAFFEGLEPSGDVIVEIKQKVAEAQVLMICSYNAWKYPEQQTLIYSLLNMNKPSILIVARDPIDASFFPGVPLIFTTYSPSAPSIRSVYDAIIKKLD